MKTKLFLICITTILFFSCSHTSKVGEHQDQPSQSWIEKSNAIAEQFTKALASHRPEVGSEIGYNEFDGRGLLLDENTEEIDRKIFSDWKEKLDGMIREASDEDLKTDLKVLQGWVQNQIDNIDVYRAAHEIEFIPGIKTVYQNLQILLNPQSPKVRKIAALQRFKVYVRGDSSHKPLLEAMQEIFQNKLELYRNKSPLLPFKGEVEQYISDSDSYLIGLEEMLKTSPTQDWQQDYQLFKEQARRYKQFAKVTVLKNCRKQPQLPIQIYSQILRRRGIELTPNELIKTGIENYKKIYEQFRKQAQIVAHKYSLKDSNPATVIKFLKSNPITTAAEVESLYKTSDQRLKQIMMQNDLISVPDAPLKIRIAGDAESKAIPVPHLVPPPLINNKGERPEFVVPSSSQGLPFDDFSSAHAAMILMAHEGRPGHDMQFSRMLDTGISVIRGRYAVNNVNIEGWGLYAEDLVFPYLTPEEQLFAYQTRLWRVARMFLDPQLQLKQIQDKRVIDVFTKELGVSEVMANLELRRYKYDDIGQAPSYFQGYLIVKKMLANSQARLGDQFNLKCFNDRLLSFGLLPLKIVSEKMMEGELCSTTFK